jgi:hypothetical protein
MSPRYQVRPRPRARSGAGFGTNAGPGGPYRSVTSTVQAMPCGATVYGPRMTCQRPGPTGPGRYPGVASDLLIVKLSRNPPDHPRNPRSLPSWYPLSSNMPMSRALPGYPAGGVGRS